jgi:hypothetical protein
MALNFGPVPAWDAPLSEKVGLLVVIGVILFCFDRLFSRRLPATMRDIAVFIALAITLWVATITFPELWKVLASLRNR